MRKKAKMKKENISQIQDLVPRLGGHRKAAGQARAGIFEVRLPRVWGGGEWLLLVDLPPKNYFMLRDASLAKERVILSERRCQGAGMYARCSSVTLDIGPPAPI